MGKTKTELQNEALGIIGDRYNIAVEIGTGGGKTLLGLKHMAKQYHPTISYCVAAPKVSIFVEWKKQAKEHGYEFLLNHITFTSYKSLHKQSINHDWLYLDECHSLTLSHSDWLESYVSAKGKILGLTGTYPSYLHSAKGKMCAHYCPKIFEYNIDEGIEDGLLNNYVIWVHMLKLSTKNTLVKKRKKGEWKTSELKDYEYFCKAIEAGNNSEMLRIMRMKAMQSYPTKTEYAKQLIPKFKSKILVFANTKKQADELSSHSYHSGNKKSELNMEMFNRGDIKVLSCVDQISEGANVPDLKIGLILHSFSNDRSTRQRIGRFLRLNPKDTAHAHILCYENSIDLSWVQNALRTFDQTKIKIYRP